jgi:hypothetical protein
MLESQEKALKILQKTGEAASVVVKCISPHEKRDVWFDIWDGEKHNRALLKDESKFLDTWKDIYIAALEVINE